jgi:aminoglycoside phosphotransferase (APT) family kinase protein
MAFMGGHGLEALGTWSALIAALSAIRRPALLIDAMGAVVHANQAAAAFLAQRRLPPLGVSDWQMTALGDPAERLGFVAVLDPADRQRA